MFVKFIVPGQPFGKMNMKPITIKNHAALCNPKPNITYMDHVINCIYTQFNSEDSIYGIDKPIFDKDVPLMVTIRAFFKLQSVHYGKKGINQSGLDKLDGKVLPTMKPDCDNISKIICDGINHSGILWFDDSQVTMLCVSKAYAEVPRVEVTVENYPIPE